ncbi:hypothetical protein GQ44DRAFT_727076 [Phaeosphaeriaceae sp. PMI808]|nr:hypothetical protein GQ44DRAFT_727076 [Phaeosphaeriaceae sp. PMI808]
MVLLIPGYGSPAKSFVTLGNAYLGYASQLVSEANFLISANGGLYYLVSGGYNFDAKTRIMRGISNITSTYWQMAYETEKEVCSMTSTNQQNFDNISGNLTAGTISSVQDQIPLFSEAEKGVIGALTQAIITAASASIGPAGVLGAGLSAAGVTGLGDIITSLQSSFASLQATTQVTWTFS